MRSKGHMAVSLCLATTQVCSEPGTDTTFTGYRESAWDDNIATLHPPSPGHHLPWLATEPLTQRLMQIESGNQAPAPAGSGDGVQISGSAENDLIMP